MKSRKRIAILAEFPWGFFEVGASGRGGGEICTWLVQLAEEFAKDCPYEIHWVTIDRKLSGIRPELKQWGRQFFHRLPGIKESYDLRMGYRLSRWQLQRQIKQIGADLVHCWGTETAYPSVCGSCGVPSILSMQGILSEYARIGGLPEMYYWRRLAAREPQLLQAATVVTCESQWGIDRVKAVHGFLRTYQVEYGVHRGFFEIPWQPDLEHPYALFSGCIDFRKGVDVLMDAVAQIEPRDWRLKFAGHGALFEEMKARNLPGVEWLGLLNWDDLQRELAGAMCLVLPTRADTSPNVVKESRVIGLPVITTRHGGQVEYIRDGENGIIVDPLEATGLAAALSRLMDDPQLACKMGGTRHAEDRAYFLPANTAQGFLAIYAELLGTMAMAPI